jgi:hypothetical protein
MRWVAGETSLADTIHGLVELGDKIANGVILGIRLFIGARPQCPMVGRPVGRSHEMDGESKAAPSLSSCRRIR